MDKIWCLKTDRHIAMVPSAVIDRIQESDKMLNMNAMASAPSLKWLVLAALINLAVTSVIVFFVWNFAVVGALAFAKSISIFQAVGLTAFLNLFVVRK